MCLWGSHQSRLSESSLRVRGKWTYLTTLKDSSPLVQRSQSIIWFCFFFFLYTLFLKIEVMCHDKSINEWQSMWVGLLLPLDCSPYEDTHGKSTNAPLDSVCTFRHAKKKKKIGNPPQYQLHMEGLHAHTLKQMHEAQVVCKFAHVPTSHPPSRCAFHDTAAPCKHVETRDILARKVASPCPAEDKPSLEANALKWN